MSQYIQILQHDNLKPLFSQYGVNYLAIFGSAARGDETQESDVDLMIDFDQTQSLFDIARVKMRLEDVLGKKVDITMRGSVKKILEPYINRDLQMIYEKN